MTEQRQPSEPVTGLSLGRLAGIEIRLDLSVVIIFTLVVGSLALGLFPRWHPDWSAALCWGTALAAGLIFFASLLAHEMAHSLVAQRNDLPVPRITLFLFGGVSEMSREPPQPGMEFRIAIVGPLTSIALGLLFLWLAGITAGADFERRFAEAPEQAISALNPLATLLLWLAPINLALGVFNLIPGFPMDGGRVLRAILWGITGDLRRATFWAASVGRAFALALMALGAIQVFGGWGLQGLWLILIGWFLHAAARNSYRQLVMTQSLRDVRVADLMRTRFDSVAADRPLRGFVEDQLLRSNQRLWPVMDNDSAVGLVGLSDCRIDAGRRDRARVRDVMRPLDANHTVDAQTEARELLDQLSAEGEPLAVLNEGQVVGLLHQSDVARWLAWHQRGGDPG